MRYAGDVQSSAPLSAKTIAYEQSDVLQTRSTWFRFLMRMYGSGYDGVDFTLDSSAPVCLDIAADRSGASIYLGASKYVITQTPVNLKTVTGACEVYP